MASSVRVMRRTRPSLIPATSIDPADEQVADVVASLENNPRVRSYSVTRDKDTGIIKARATTTAGTRTKEILAPGLERVTKFDRFNHTSEECDEAIMSLLRLGCTQQETAEQTGFSQSHVSNVARRLS